MGNHIHRKPVALKRHDKPQRAAGTASQQPQHDAESRKAVRGVRYEVRPQVAYPGSHMVVDRRRVVAVAMGLSEEKAEALAARLNRENKA